MPLTEKQCEYQRLYYRQHRERRLAASCERQRKYKEEKRAYDSARRALKGDALREYDRARSKVYGRRLLQLVQRARARAIANGLPFSITTADIEIPEYCPVLGLKLDWHHRQGGWDNSPSLDRLVGALGYVPGNVVVISSKANRIKTNATADEIQKVATWLSQACLQTGNSSGDGRQCIESAPTP